MRSRTPRAPRAALHLTTLLALVAAPLAMGFAAPAAAVASAGLIITEVYPGGGNTGATYNADFVELYNASDNPISLNGKSLQYRSATNIATPVGAGVFALPSVSVPSHSYFLVKGSGSAVGADIPRTPDATSSLAMGAGGGQIYLADSATGIQPITGGTSVCGGGAIDYAAGKVIDFFGYGTQAAAPACSSNTVSYEGASKSGTITVAGSYKRLSLVDADNNNTDFTITAVNATSGSGSGNGPDNCDCVVTPALKITEVYTDGGQAGSAFDHDFVELQNTGTSTLSMAGLTLQYRAPGDTGPATVVATLTGAMAPGTFDVAQLAGSDGNGAALPSPEYPGGTLDLSAAGGTLFVAKSPTAINPGSGAVGVDQFRGDLVGWGTAGAFETAAADAADLAPAISIQRANGGVDAGDNSADFASYAPSPHAQPAIPDKTIPEIQGTGLTTPLANANVSTAGVVTAAYANGTDSFNGFYLQTAGHDPATDATPLASDGIFVYTGTSATFPTPAVGQHVTISSGKVSEFRGMTELTVTNPANLRVRTADLREAVKPGAVLPGTDCALPGTDCLKGAALAAAREAHEGELFQPTAPYTVTDSYDGSPWDQPSEGFQMKGEIGLAANSADPLIAPTEVANPTRESAAHAARVVWNEAHRVTLDDGHNADYTTTANRAVAFPWLTPTHTVRVGAAVTFVQPLVFDFRNDLWKLQPQSKVTGDGESKVAIEQDRPAAPSDVLGATGNLKIATFNMLNYFVHTAQDWAATTASAVGKDYTCSYNRDRAGVATTADSCSWTDLRMDPDLANAPGPRGAANAASLTRQEDKELEAINNIDADVLSLEEVENAIKIGDFDRDAALQRLVPALNAHWSAAHPGEDPALGDRWAYVASPRPAAQATILEQDAIRPAFIYNPRTVETVGRSQMLVNSAPFRNAREPLAQGFKRVGGNRDDGFIVIANHFKSKSPTGATGDNVDKGDGAGSYNGDRTRQAKALAAFADSLSADLDIPAVFLTGDLNAYSNEDPILALDDAGYHPLESDNGEKSYSFGGYSGSLDHALANDAALAMVTGSTVWTINANEPVFYEYSRNNANATDLYAVNPYRSSDHNPEIIGINAPKNPPVADLDTVQVLASNDFHGRLLDDPASASAGAAAMATAVKALRDPVTGNPHTVFAMAGDIVGASTFESFIQNDKPTIDAMNEAGLEVSAAGNHEFDQGYDDLMNRIMSATDPEGGTAWPYIAANVRDAGDNSYALESTREDGNFANSNGATWWKEFDGLNGGAGIRVGFVGAVTEDLESLVAPGSLDGLAITSVVDEVNTAAAGLKTGGGCGGADCDLVVELVHEGAPSPSCDAIRNETTSTFGRIVHGASTDVDAIVSGHTHLKYNCKVVVPGKTLSNGAEYKRPVVSAGQYGSYVNQLQFDFAPGTADLVGIRQHVLAMKDFEDDAGTKAIVDAAVTVAAEKGAVELGQVNGPFKRARRTDASGTVENRGGESTLGNLVAEIQREATDADIGVMNPGGLRDDLIGTGNGPGPVTYREAANVQPFANTLVTTDLTGAQLKLLLEQQWQRDPDNNVPSRPFLRLGTSKGFTWTEDSSRAEGNRITGMWLNGTAIDAGETYTVAANSFVASGGDNFRALTLGSNKRDTGVTDLQATVDYLDAHAPLSVDFAQHAVGARVPAGPFAAGDTVTIPVDSLSMTGDGDTTDATMNISIGARDLGSFAVTSNLPTTPFDISGAGTVSFVLPSGLSGPTELVTLTGATTGTVATVKVPVVDTRADSTVSGTAADITWGEAGSVSVTVTPTATGKVELYDGADKIGEGTLAGDATTIAIPAESLAVGTHTFTLKYLGDDDTKPSQGSVQVTVVKASSAVSGTAADITWGDAGSVSVTVAPAAATGTVELYDGATKLGEGTLASGSTTVAIAAQALAVGNHSLTLKFLGDGNHATDDGTVSVTVVKASSTVSGTSPDITWGRAGAVSVTLTPAAATGAVELYDGATKLGEGTLASGSTTVAIPARALPVGTHSLTLKYLGDGHYTSSQSTVVVKVVKVTTTVSGAAASWQWAKSGSVTITVSPAAATGKVELYNGATKLGGATLSGGTATITVASKALDAGTYTLVVKYLGSDTHAASQGTARVTVMKSR